MTLPADPIAQPAPHAPPRRHRRIPYWLLAIILLGVMIGWAIVADSDYARIWNTLSRGVGTTLFVTFIAFAMAMLLGLAVAMARTSGNRVLVEIATFYVEIVRGIPI